NHSGRVLASPKARRIAEERGIDIRTILGSGPHGAVLTADVSASQPSGGSRGSLGEATTYENPGNLWRIMSERMSESWTTIPHFYLARDVGARRLLEWKERSGAEIEEKAGTRLTVTDLLVKVVASVLKNHPRVNGGWSGDRIRLNGVVNVGIAVALDEGLVVPVISNADSASLSEIAGSRGRLVAAARGRKLRPEDIAGGTFTITNLGMFNVDAFNAIVNPTQAAILAVGRIADRVVPVDGRPEVRPMMTLTLSCDHRVVDGARAARFLDELAQTIEDPWRILL
ncbi:MAG TPA: dihydrolipoamide acetyltransferase family protein, partial [Spirochaetia bacterium]|nr:dihydrolipoamide acetyltransferase family protein [Spirochaetia bacterium]